jgi:hypothetical protein
MKLYHGPFPTRSKIDNYLFVEISRCLKCFGNPGTTGLGFRTRRQVTKAQLDALEVKGYLDPDLRGQVADEAEAVELFLTDALANTK